MHSVSKLPMSPLAQENLVLLRSWSLSTHVWHSLTLDLAHLRIPLGHPTTVVAKRLREISGISSWVLGLETCWVWLRGGTAGPQTLCKLSCHEKPHQPGAGTKAWAADSPWTITAAFKPGEILTESNS